MRKVCALIISALLLTGCDAVLKPPQQKKLADVTSQQVNLTLQCPRGESFRLLFGVPEAKVDWSKPKPHISKPPNFRGVLVISQQGKQIGRFPLSSTNINRSN